MASDPDPYDDHQPLVISYLTIRKAIGLLGFFLPFLLWLGVWIVDHQTEVQPSISDYYYTIMRNIFVGILCAVALFLFAYRGYEKVDRITGYFGCLFALGIAFFPTTPAISADGTDVLIGRLHLAFAGLFFATLVFFSLFLFTRTHSNLKMTERKKIRNTVYYVCGYVMLACVVAIAIFFLVGNAQDAGEGHSSLVFWCESIALMAFGVSWLVKGEIILKDLNHQATH